MRVQLVFKLDQPLPLFYRLGTLAIIKEAIQNSSADYYTELFEKQRKNMKPFCYGTYIPELKIKEQKIHGKLLHMTISSPSYEFIMHLMNGSKKGNTYRIGQTTLVLTEKKLLPRKVITSSTVVFKSLSPIHLENQLQQPMLAIEPSFKEELSFLATLILQQVYEKTPKQPIQILQTMLKKQVIKENIHQRQSTPIFLTCNKGFIQVQGDPEDLQRIYEAGLSLRRSLGFGLLEIEGEVN
mgnify:CR=1 FL=1